MQVHIAQYRELACLLPCQPVTCHPSAACTRDRTCARRHLYFPPPEDLPSTSPHSIPPTVIGAPCYPCCLSLCYLVTVANCALRVTRTIPVLSRYRRYLYSPCYPYYPRVTSLPSLPSLPVLSVLPVLSPCYLVTVATFVTCTLRVTRAIPVLPRYRRYLYSPCYPCYPRVTPLPPLPIFSVLPVLSPCYLVTVVTCTLRRWGS